jgi:hypothetical protein
MINTLLPRYLAVTPEAIRDAAAEVFHQDNRLVITYLPEGPAADDVALAEPGPEAADEQAAA